MISMFISSRSSSDRHSWMYGAADPPTRSQKASGSRGGRAALTERRVDENVVVKLPDVRGCAGHTRHAQSRNRENTRAWMRDARKTNKHDQHLSNQQPASPQ